MKKNFYLTTPIFYPNGILHLGHAYTVTVADIISRFKISEGCNVVFQTGSDEHGEKIIKESSARDMTPIELVDSNVEKFKDLFRKINLIENHYFMRTSFTFHEEKVKNIFLKILKNGDIYEGFYDGNYCISCEEYNISGEFCGSCFSKLTRISEKCFFLKVEKYREKLIECYRKGKIAVEPKSSLNEVFESFLNKKMPDLSITRRKLDWGIKVPGHPELTFYVWFEALCNYITSPHGEKMYESKKNHSEIVQVIGKDIARFHLVYWPIILLSLNKKLPDQILSHGWILQSGFKMSKSKGNVVDPISLIDKYGSDTLRCFFCSKINFLSDGSLSEESLLEFHNDFFVNKFGNLFSRTRSMLEKYFSFEVPFSNSPFCSDYVNFSELKTYNYISLIEKEVGLYKNNMNSFQLTKAFRNVENIIVESNKFISLFSPWEIFNAGDDLFLSEVIVCLVNSIKIASFLILPFAPECGNIIISEIGLDCSKISLSNVLSFSLLKNLKFRNSKNHLFVKL